MFGLGVGTQQYALRRCAIDNSAIARETVRAVAHLVHRLDADADSRVVCERRVEHKLVRRVVRAVNARLVRR
eukprot:scaffold33957_cov91-Phaeocystis_antarctica.AAC.2